MVAGENDDRVLTLTRPVKVLDDTCELVVDERDHGVVERLRFSSIDLFRCLGLRLKVDGREFLLSLKVTRLEMRARHGVWIEAVGVRLWWDERWMWIVRIDIEHPWFVLAMSRVQELDRPLSSPCGLVKFRRHAIFTFPHGL